MEKSSTSRHQQMSGESLPQTSSSIYLLVRAEQQYRQSSAQSNPFLSAITVGSQIQATQLKTLDVLINKLHDAAPDIGENGGISTPKAMSTTFDCDQLVLDATSGQRLVHQH